MVPHILIIGPESHTRFLVEAVGALARLATIEVINTPEKTFMVDGTNLAALTAEDGLKFLAAAMKCEPPEDLDLDDYHQPALDGIAELQAWFENVVRQVLNVFGGARRQHRLPTFQPCWSAKRFKSLT